jgi:hypothetical protein
MNYKVMVRYKIWENTTENGKYYCLKGLEGVDKVYELSRGVKKNKISENARFEVEKKGTKKRQFSDSLVNWESLLVISSGLKEFIEKIKLKNVELLPVSIHHEKIILKEKYFILNALQVIDCIDQEKSEISWNSIDPNFFAFCSNIQIKKNSIPKNLILFRPMYLQSCIMIREDIANLIEENFSGNFFCNIEEFER